MHSIPAAMTWELLARGRWLLILVTLSTIALPSCVLFALQQIGSVDPQDKSIVIMHIMMMFMFIFMYGAILHSAQGTISRLYAFPIRTSEIVGWRLLPSMLIIALQMAVSIGLLNLLFDLNWPIWGPMLAAATAQAVLQPVVWLTEKSVPWLIISVTIVGVALAGWFRWRYGPLNVDAIGYWRVVTPAELLTMLAAALAGYWLGVRAVARNRRGEPPLSLGFIDWINRLLEIAPSIDPPIRSAYQAQCWYEWRRKGWVMPAAALAAVIAGVIGWAIASRDPEHLFVGFVVGNAFLYCFALIGGVVFGNTGPNDAVYAMGQFLATRPLADAEFARAILRTATKSIYLACLIWAVAFLVVSASLAAFGATRAMQMPDEPHWPLRLLFTLVAPWTLMATLLCIGLTGYTMHITILASTTLVTFVCGSLAAKFFLTPGAQLILWRSLAVGVAVSLILVTAWVYAVARRRGFIPPTTAWLAAITWAAVVLASTIFWPATLQPSLLGYLAVAAGTALFVAPFAAAPLALATNRHR